jgi:hypothetical protein
VPSLLRWSSLLVALGVLYALGVRRLHLHDFNTFLAVLLVVTGAVVGVFLLTRDRPPPRPGTSGV